MRSVRNEMWVKVEVGLTARLRTHVGYPAWGQAWDGVKDRTGFGFQDAVWNKVKGHRGKEVGNER